MIQAGSQMLNVLRGELRRMQGTFCGDDNALQPLLSTFNRTCGKNPGRVERVLNDQCLDSIALGGSTSKSSLDSQMALAIWRTVCVNIKKFSRRWYLLQGSGRQSADYIINNKIDFQFNQITDFSWSSTHKEWFSPFWSIYVWRTYYYECVAWECDLLAYHRRIASWRTPG